MLPQEFVNRMQDMLGDEYSAYIKSYEGGKYQALRINPLKADREEFVKKAPFGLTQVPWEENGYYYEETDQPGKHPWHEAGVYYIQEPSAMAPAEYLAPKPGERILDLCAAPGGKSTQIAVRMQGKGLLVCNEIHPQRAKILSENIERMGIRNALVTNETPKKLADIFDAYFDRILVDAPCSGEGMFRKNEEACKEWTPQNVQLCADRQDEILEYAASMLRPGGRLVYSTCTFAPLENEGSISRFLEKHSEFQILEAKRYEGMTGGVGRWIAEPAQQIDKTIRLWPHKLRGEGHYLAVLEKEGEVPGGYEVDTKYGVEKGITDKECKEYAEFKQKYLKTELEGGLLKFGEQLYLMPQNMPSIHKLRVLRPGLHLGTLKKNRFEPSHALALALRPEEVRQVMHIESTQREAAAYLNGQTLSYTGEKGWYLLTVDGYSIGWGKLAGQIMKNHYPKGLRKS